jgi:hypothetical protein
VLDLVNGMSKIVDQIVTLRAALRSADMQDPNSFSSVFHAFFDISEKSEFMDSSDLVQDPIVRAMIESIVRQHARDPNLAVTMFQLLRHAPTGLLHGSSFTTRFVGTFFYFEADQQGLVAFTDGTPRTHYYRITATVLPPGAMPMRRPSGKH